MGEVAGCACPAGKCSIPSACGTPNTAVNYFEYLQLKRDCIGALTLDINNLKPHEQAKLGGSIFIGLITWYAGMPMFLSLVTAVALAVFFFHKKLYHCICME